MNVRLVCFLAHRVNVCLTATSHLCNNCHEMCRRGLIVKSLARFHSEDPAVPIDGKLGERGGLRGRSKTQDSVSPEVKQASATRLIPKIIFGF